MKSLARIAQDLGLEVLAENKTHKNRMEVRSESSNRIYVIAQSKATGEWQCSCPGWVLKKQGRERGCKHLAAILPVLTAEIKKIS